MKIKIESKTKKGKFISGYYLKGSQAGRVLVLMSGFDGGMDSSLIANSALSFNSFKNNTFRFNFCDKNKGLRLSDLTFSNYILELKNIIDYFYKKHEKIILIGHSFGAVLAIMFLNKYKSYSRKIDLILWEPTMLPWKRRWMEEDYIFDSKTNLYYNKYQKEIINKKLYEECVKIDTKKLISSINLPVCIIVAKGSADTDAKKYFLKLKNKKKNQLIIINNTDHSFSDKKSQKILFNSTQDFLNLMDEKKIDW